ncbi:MAG TPA: hypothetical protein VM513_22730 [Kofleriaceae bacterium]|nr:hypothetical protein [Kofleriaceae bacterium]
MRAVISLGLLVLAVVVWLILREPSAGEHIAAPAAAAKTVAPEAATTSVPGAVAAPAGAEPARLPPPSPSLPPAAKGMKTQLKERIASVEPAIAQCLALTAEQLTGIATLDFVAGIEPSTGLAVVETTGIVDDGTTIASEPVLACLHEAARGMPPLPLPDGIESAYVAWRLELVDGEVKDRRVTEYALRKPTDGPFD